MVLELVSDRGVNGLVGENGCESSHIWLRACTMYYCPISFVLFFKRPHYPIEAAETALCL